MTLVLAYAMMMAVSELQACDAHLLLSRVNVGCALLLALLWGWQKLVQRLAHLHEEPGGAKCCSRRGRGCWRR
jgi:hypothetical protein